jgi:hypothetical protein
MPGRAGRAVASRDVRQAERNFPADKILTGRGNLPVRAGVGLSILVRLCLVELMPPDGQRRICWLLELCSCHALARHARHLTDHRLEVNTNPPDGGHGRPPEENKP